MKTGFVPHGKSRIDHEVEMARSDLLSAAKNAQQVYLMIKDISEEEGLEGWVQEKIIKANDYLNTIREYLEGKQFQGMAEGEVYDLEKEYGYEKPRSQSRRSAPSDYPYSQQDDDAYFNDIFRKKRLAKQKQEREQDHDRIATGTNEGAKVDRMVKHIEKSEEKTGKSKKEAENIAWATANKRGMLDNKNKKK